MSGNSKIIVEDGGILNISGSVAFQGNDGALWNGIEFQDGGYGNIDNCTFSNTKTPIVIKSTGDSPPPTPNFINVTNCTFNDGYLQIDSRPYDYIAHCTWNYSSVSADVCGL
jgi:hypothetical protein